MVASNTVVVAIWLNVLWYTSQKCRLTWEDKKEYKSRWMYVCICLCVYLCSSVQCVLLLGKHPQKIYMWKDTGAALSISHHIIIIIIK